MIEIHCISIDSCLLEPNVNEVSLRLGIPRGETIPQAQRLTEEIKTATKCKAAWAQVPIKRENGQLDLGFEEFISHDLEKNLSGCDEAFIFCVTLGIDVDRLLLRYSLTSSAEHFALDGLASSICEAAADKAEEIIKGDTICKPRYSPGYGDMALETQVGLLNMLDARRLLGVSLSKSLLMTPMKTITAILGIKNEEN